MNAILNIKDSGRYKDWSGYLHSIFNKDRLSAIAKELQSEVPGPYAIMLDGVPVGNPEKYFPQGKKLYAFRSEELANYIALFLHNPDNFRQYFDAMEEVYRNFFSRLVYRRFVHVSEFLAEGMADVFEVREERYSYREIYTLVRHDCWTVSRVSYGMFESRDSLSYYHKDSYLGLNPYFNDIFAAALGMLPSDVVSDTPPSGTECVCAETTAPACLPVFDGLSRQGKLKFSAFKVTAASSRKALDILPLEDIGLKREGHKENLGQLFFPLLNYVREKQSSLNCPDTVRRCVQVLYALQGQFKMPMLLPHIKGWRAGRLYASSNAALIPLQSTLEAVPDKWIDLEKLFRCNWMDMEFSASPRMLEEMYLQNDWTGLNINLANMDRAIDLSLLQAYSAILYALGAAEVAISPASEEEIQCSLSPFSHIKALRLTALGIYAFGLSKEYHLPDNEETPLFALDDNRLIIRSLVPGNSYEALLQDIATPIGNKRFVMSHASFLRNCSSASNVKEKIKFFEDYICKNPPEVWKNFFTTIESRCKPLKKEKNEFHIYVLDPSDQEMINLVSSDPELRKYVIKAEGYRILVPNAKHDAFIARLKTFGYLL